MKPVKETRSGIDAANIQEVLDAEDSVKWATLGNQQQYCTPAWLAEDLAKRLPSSNPITILDPQIGNGNTVSHGIGWRPTRFGIDIDNRLSLYSVRFIQANCVKVFEAMDDLYPDLRFECINANPPFGKRWTVDGKVIDSTEHTWNEALKRGCFGYFISNYKTIERLGINKHPFVTSYTKHKDVWKQCEVEIGCIVWHNPNAKPHLAMAWWEEISKVIEEEKKERPLFNIWRGKDGKLKSYLSTRSTVKHKLTRDDVLKLAGIAGSHPLALTTERETRTILGELVDSLAFATPSASSARRKGFRCRTSPTGWVTLQRRPPRVTPDSGIIGTPNH